MADLFLLIGSERLAEPGIAIDEGRMYPVGQVPVKVGPEDAKVQLFVEVRAEAMGKRGEKALLRRFLR
jgi:hypothetical protein